MKLELIMCIQDEVSSEILGKELGLIPSQDFHSNLTSDKIWFIPREFAEKNSSFKQLIPYIIIRCGNEFLTYRRTKNGTEDRLHDLYSIGIGGHINLLDCDSMVDGSINVKNTIYRACLRELNEELKLNYDVFKKLKVQTLGYLYKEETEVDTVHMGLVFILDYDPSIMKIGSIENTLSDVRFTNITELKKLNLESWSKTCLENLIKNYEGQTTK